MSEYVPTMNDVKHWLCEPPYAGGPFDDETAAKFDAALAAHDAEVAAKALEEVAETIATALPGSEAVGYYASESDSGYLEAERDIEGHLRARAAEYRKAVQAE